MLLCGKFLKHDRKKQTAAVVSRNLFLENVIMCTACSMVVGSIFTCNKKSHVFKGDIDPNKAFAQDIM